MRNLSILYLNVIYFIVFIKISICIDIRNFITTALRLLWVEENRKLPLYKNTLTSNVSLISFRIA